MKLKSTWVPFFLSFVAVMGIRVYQILSVGVPAVRMQWDNFEMLCFWISAIATVVILIMSYMSKDAPEVFVVKKNLPTGIVSIVASLVVMLSSASELQQSLSSGMDIQALIRDVLGVAAGIVFIIFGLCFIKEKNLFEKYSLLVCLPSIWATMILAKLFAAYNAIRTDFIHVTDVLAIVCLLFFLFEQSRLFVGLFNAGSFRKLFFFGFGAVLFIMTFVTNDLAHAIDAGRQLDTSEMLMLATQLAMVLYVVSFLLAVKVGQDAEFVEEITSGASEEPVNKEPFITTNEATEEDTIYTSTEMAEVDALIADIQNETAQKD